MNTVILFPNNTRIEAEAASWIARLDAGPLSDPDRRTLREWLHTSPAHAEALQEHAQLWHQLDSLNILAELFPPPSPPAPQMPSLIKGGLAASIALSLTLLGLFYLTPGIRDTATPSIAQEQTLAAPIYTTRQGERSSIVLQDGSVLTLNTQSRAEVAFDRERRTVYLTAGEAHFQVAPDSDRPFVVHAGHGQVVAIGTAFNVRLINQQVEVVVDEGVVRVVTQEPPQDPSQDAREDPHQDPRQKQLQEFLPEATNQTAITLEKGNVARYAHDITHTETLPSNKIEQRLAWRQGKWRFEGETLTEVLDEVIRYSSQEIIITDPELADLRIGGYFDIGDVSGLMSALQLGFNIQVDREGDRILLSSTFASEEG